MIERSIERKPMMPDHYPLSDDEIAEILGDALPVEPMEVVELFPAVDAEWPQRYLQRLENWLIRQVSLAEVQAELITPDTIPSFRSEFAAFASAATELHNTWEFCSPQSDWEQLAGCCGYALVKEGKVTHVITTMES